MATRVYYQLANLSYDLIGNIQCSTCVFIKNLWMGKVIAIGQNDDWEIIIQTKDLGWLNSLLGNQTESYLGLNRDLTQAHAWSTILDLY